MSGEKVHTLTVDAAKAGQRVDLFVGEALGLSRAKLKRLFEEGAVKVNGRPAKKGLLVTGGQNITVEYEEETREAVPDTGFPAQVVE